MATTDASKEFFSMYSDLLEKEIEERLVAEVEDIRRLNARLQDIALGEILAAEHFAGLRFVG